MEKTLSPLPRQGESLAVARELCASSLPSQTGGAGGGSLMTCRHCLRFALGYCTRDGRKLPFREPLSLRLSDGRTFPLRFDCKACEMQVLSGG